MDSLRPYADSAGEFLLPSGTFKGPDASKDLRNGRCIMLLFYIAFGGVFVYTIVALIFSGRVEVMQTAYKMDMIEAPSIVVCPFYPGASLVLPEDAHWPSLLTAYKYGLDGEEKLETKAYECKYDRTCACMNLYRGMSKDHSVHDVVQFHDHVQADVSKIGTTGEKSENRMTFRERIEVRTNVTDPSPDKTLKVGFYDSVDTSPQWWYMRSGAWVLGSLELQTWTVSDISFESMWATMKGDVMAMGKSRHIFRYTSQEVGGSGERGMSDQSFISYEMKNFFVDDTLSSESAFSVYTLFFLLFLIAVRSAVISVFTNIMFPEYNENKDSVVHRENSGPATTMESWCSCCCIFPSLREKEREPLLASRNP